MTCLISIAGRFNGRRTGLHLASRAAARLRGLLAASIVCALAACGGDGADGSASGGGGYSVGGSATGIVTANQVILQNNGGDDLPLAGNGEFTFRQTMPAGGTYSVSLSSVPPGQACIVMFSSGVAAANVTTVKVVCGPSEQSVIHDAATMVTPRQGHRLIPLPDGAVLAMGGQDMQATGIASIERYDPQADRWTPAGNLPMQRLSAAAYLPRDGKVLVSGAGAVPQLYDPRTQGFAPTEAFSRLLVASDFIVLLDGRVFATDGHNVELYDPATGEWSASVPTVADHTQGAFVLLGNGKVLAAGGLPSGATIADSEVFDPATGQWSAAAAMATSRAQHQAILMPNGKVLVVGGVTGSYAQYCGCGLNYVPNAELYDPSSNAWSPAGTLNPARAGFTATLMPTGHVLVGGGNTQGQVQQVPTGGFVSSIPMPLDSIVAYDPQTNGWSAWGSTRSPRSQHAAALMASGKLLHSGGEAAYPDDPTNPDPYAWHIEWVVGSEIGW